VTKEARRRGVGQVYWPSQFCGYAGWKLRLKERWGKAGEECDFVGGVLCRLKAIHQPLSRSAVGEEAAEDWWDLSHDGAEALAMAA
jgi:hypothetical protein